MSFGGNIFAVQVTEKKVKITGALLAANASGVIVLDGFGGQGTPDVVLKAPNWQTYTNAIGDMVYLHQAITVGVVFESGPRLIAVRKAGVSHQDFQLVISNPGALPTGEMEITLEYQ